MKVLIFSILLYPILLKAQENGSSLNDNFLVFFKGVNEFYGNTYLDTSYRKCDTSQLKKDLGVEIEPEIRFIREFNLKLAEFDISKLSNLKSKMVDANQFWKLHDDTVTMSSNDIKYNEKLDSFYRVIHEDYEDNVYIQNILLSSTFDQLSREANYKPKKKWLQIASIYENENFILIIYFVSAIYGHLHSIKKSELLIK